jgi:hypothetical protein
MAQFRRDAELDSRTTDVKASGSVMMLRHKKADSVDVGSSVRECASSLVNSRSATVEATKTRLPHQSRCFI